LNKAANIYWDNSNAGSTASRRPNPARKRRITAKAGRRTAPWWLSFLIVTCVFAMLCVSINFRAFSEMREEASQHEQLGAQIQNLMDENLALQEEIHTLKTDSQVIRREAKRIGIDLQREKVPVPAN
jgi:cell division protein FtsB